MANNYGYSYEYQVAGKTKWYKRIVWCKSEKERDGWLTSAKNNKSTFGFSAVRKIEPRVR